MSITPQETIEARIINRAKEDPEFKQQLLANAKAVFEQELGQKLPDKFEIQALQQSPQKLYVLLPMSRDEVPSELSEAELEAVSGGGTPAIAAATAVSTVVVGLTDEYNCFL